MPETQTLAVERQSLAMPASVKELIEALIFAAEEPLTVEQIHSILQEGVQDGDLRALKESEIETVISVLNDEYQQSNRSYRILRIAGGYQFATTADYAEWIGKLYKEQGRRKLSQSSLETLAIIAYRQPITRPDIEAIRGVDCDYVLGTLLEKKLVTIVGRAPTPGRPLLYGTTQQFLKHFGLNDISDLPRPREIEELLADARYETERRMLEAQEQAEKAKKEEEDFKSRLPHIPKKKPDLDDSATIVPKKPGRSLTVKKSEEKKEADSQPEANELAVEPPKAEAAEIHEETVALNTAPDSVTEQTGQDSSPNIEEAKPRLETPITLLPQLSSPVATTEEERDGAEIQKPHEGTAVELTLSKTIDEPVQAEESVSSDEEGVVLVELKMAEPDQSVEEPIPAIAPEVSSSETVTNEIESQNVSSSVDTQKQAPGEVQDESVKMEMPSSVVPEAETRRQGEEEDSLQGGRSLSDELKTQLELSTEQTPPPIDATSVVVDVAPPALAPIVDEVREPAQSKSRWTRFKEKIQGFIKKVFG